MLLYPLPGLTALGGYLVLAGLLWTGFLGGVLSAMAVLQLGVRGLLFLSAAVLPQALIYVPASLFYLTAVYRMSEKSRLAGGPERKKYREYFLACGSRDGPGPLRRFSGMLCKSHGTALGFRALKKCYKKLTIIFFTTCSARAVRSADILLKTVETSEKARFSRKNRVCIF